MIEKEAILGKTTGQTKAESTKQMEEKLNFQVPAEGLELVILLHTQYQALRHHKLKINDDRHFNVFFVLYKPYMPIIFYQKHFSRFSLSKKKSNLLL